MGAACVQVILGDVTTLEVDAIVNAANAHLAGGGGVDGAIHRAAGPELVAACARIGGCPTGEARLTPGFGLPARYVIHTVGPVWQGGGAGEADLLASCYRQAMALAAVKGLRTLAFPAISTGIYGFPAKPAAEIAVRTVMAELPGSGLDDVIFCCFGETSAALHASAFDARELADHA